MKKFNMTSFVIWIFIIALLVFYINETIVMHRIENGHAENNTLKQEDAGTVKEEKSSEKDKTVKENEKETAVSETNKFDGELEIYYFYVGQADCILIKDKDKTMLIDAGNNDDGNIISKYLKDELKISKIDYLIGTHAHEDHIGGLDNIIKKFNIGTIYMPSKETSTKTFEDVINAVESKKLKIKTPKIGEKFNLADAECEIVYVDNDAEDINESSIVIAMKHGENKYLFTADIGSVSEESISWDDIDVLKVAHHGSRKSTSDKFLKQAKPEIAIITLGKENEYGYPHAAALKRLQKANAEIYRTDIDGTILLKSDGSKIEIEKVQLSLDGNY